MSEATIPVQGMVDGDTLEHRLESCVGSKGWKSNLLKFHSSTSQLWSNCHIAKTPVTQLDGCRPVPGKHRYTIRPTSSCDQMAMLNTVTVNIAIHIPDGTYSVFVYLASHHTQHHLVLCKLLSCRSHGNASRFTEIYMRNVVCGT